MASQRTHAFRAAGLAVVDAMTGFPGEPLEDIARVFVKSADPHQVRGPGGKFEWSFGYGDVPEIVTEARKLLALAETESIND